MKKVDKRERRRRMLKRALLGAAIGGAVSAAGIGGYYVYRRRKGRSAPPSQPMSMPAPPASKSAPAPHKAAPKTTPKDTTAPPADWKKLHAELTKDRPYYNSRKYIAATVRARKNQDKETKIHYRYIRRFSAYGTVPGLVRGEHRYQRLQQRHRARLHRVQAGVKKVQARRLHRRGRS